MNDFLFTHYTATITVGYGWMAVFIIWCIGRLTAKRIAKPQPALSSLIYFGLMFLMMAMLFNHVFFSDETVISHGRECSTLGVAVFTFGIFMTVWSRISLASNWSASVAIKENHVLIEKGPYKSLRHPMYTGLTSMVIGSAIVKGSVDSIVAAVGFLFLHIWKLRREEAILSAHFPDSYPDYKKRTNALIPFIF
jgi:protein-S-isoprenylcysteine O-methyltransferase Ste14